MSRLPRRQRNFHGLGIAHLADHDHIGRLPQRGAQRCRKIRRVDADLDLLDDALLVRVLVLDRILNRDDVLRIAPVDFVDERRHGRRLSSAGGAADEHEPMMQPRHLLDLRRQTEIAQKTAGWPAAARMRRGRTAALAVQIDAKATQPARRSEISAEPAER